MLVSWPHSNDRAAWNICAKIKLYRLKQTSAGKNLIKCIEHLDEIILLLLFIVESNIW